MADYVTLPGSMRQILPNSEASGPIDPSEVATLTLRVRSVTDPDALSQKVYDLADTALEKRKYLTHAELKEQYGARNEDIGKIEHFAQQQDLKVVCRNQSERLIVLRGKLGDLLTAFPSDVQMYHHATRTYRGRKGEIRVPQELSGIVTGIFGFDTRLTYCTPHQMSAVQRQSGVRNGVPATEFAKRYNFPTSVGGMTLDGTGQTIAIIALGGSYRSSDVDVFFRDIGVRCPNVELIPVDQVESTSTEADSVDVELTLDIEVAGAVAPGANIAVYFSTKYGYQGVLNALSAAVHDSERKPSVISISWGSPETSVDNQIIMAFHQLFVEAAVLGITVCVASGDHGTAFGSHLDGKIHVAHPACDDIVLACGGTQIVDGIDIVWNDGTPFGNSSPGGGGWASGGGVSTIFAVPSYQANANVPVSIDSGKLGRGVPDIAMSATNYFTYINAVEDVAVGTSMVAPLMAALVARLNQAKGKNVGFLNPFLYANVAKGIVLDVTSGTNAITNTVKGYDAGLGWDACTGLGIPDGTAILNNL